MCNSIYSVIGVRHGTDDEQRLLFFYNNDVLLCERHLRGMLFQPFTTFDAEEGYGKHGCPFCKKELKYSDYRSQKKFLAALEAFCAKLEENQDRGGV